MTDTLTPAAPKEIELKIDGNTVQVLQQIQQWHTAAHEQLVTLLDNGKAGVTLDLGSDLKVELNEDSASGFRIACLIAKSLFGTLPFTLSPPAEEEEVPEV